jgi:hypothetical protein
MFWNGADFCDYCRLPLLDDDKVKVKLPLNGKTYVFALHNRNSEDCLAQTLKGLCEQFAAPQ